MTYISNEVFSLFDTFEQAEEAAAQHARKFMLHQFAGMLYHQGDRQMLITAMPLSVIAYDLRFEPNFANKILDDRFVRPVLQEHTTEVSGYLRANPHYILPPLTLIPVGEVRCFTTTSYAPVRNAIVLVPRGTLFSVSDGQHRIAAIKQAIKTKQKLELDSIGVNIVFEERAWRIKQDFADCAQTRQLPSALLIMYDVRHPIYPLLHRLLEEVNVFRGRIDRTSLTLSKTSPNLFTLSQLRLGIAEVLLGTTRFTETELRFEIEEYLNSSDRPSLEYRVIRFYDLFARYNEVWSILNSPDILKANIPLLRDRYVHLTGTGLQVISRVGHFIMSRPEDEVSMLIARLGALDYRREAEMWSSNIVDAQTQRVMAMPPRIHRAVRVVKEAIGLEITDYDMRQSFR